VLEHRAEPRHELALPQGVQLRELHAR
jgi:hypothetical protein